MSAHELPEDLTRWPEDPYSLLGVAPGVQPRDLRRAYTSLIRTYKPEQYPEHFRRIREAYESVLRHVELFGSLILSPVEEEDQPESAPMPEAAPLPGWKAASGLHEELDQLWKKACGGEEAAAYRRLVELLQAHQGNIDICLRLYWLLALTPELDPQRSPCDWLVQGMQASGLSGPLRELYRREIAGDPAEALGERFNQLLQLPVRPEVIADLVEWRWGAAGQLECWPVIADDLAALRDRVAREDEEIWVRMLFSAVEQLGLMPDEEARQLIQKCSREVARYEHLHVRLADGLDRFEFILEVANQWRRLIKEPQIPAPLARLIPLSWARPFPEVRPLLLSFLEQVVQHPREALKNLDQVKQLAPAVLAQFGNLLSLLEGSQSDPAVDERSVEQLRHLVRDFLAETEWDLYRQLRPKLLDFCLEEAVAPEQVAEATTDPALARDVADDWPLRYVCQAHRLFWA